MSDKKLLLRKFFEYTFTKHKARVSITKYLRRRVLTRSVWKIFKNREIIRNHREVGRNEPKWGDLLVGWRETAGLENSSMGWFQPQLRIIYCYKKVCVIFFFFFFFSHRNKEKNLNFTNLPYFFKVEKIIYSSFLLPWKFVESTCFLKQCNSFGDSSLWKQVVNAKKLKFFLKK